MVKMSRAVICWEGSPNERFCCKRSVSASFAPNRPQRAGGTWITGKASEGL